MPVRSSGSSSQAERTSRPMRSPVLSCRVDTRLMESPAGSGEPSALVQIANERAGFPDDPALAASLGFVKRLIGALLQALAGVAGRVFGNPDADRWRRA